MKLTGAVAHMVMDEWACCVKRSMERTEMEVYMMRKYVDVNLAMECVKRGSRWKGGLEGEIEWMKETEKEDVKEGRTEEEVTMEVFRTLAGTFSKHLKFTVDMGKDGKKVPMLDLQV